MRFPEVPSDGEWMVVAFIGKWLILPLVAAYLVNWILFGVNYHKACEAVCSSKGFYDSKYIPPGRYGTSGRDCICKTKAQAKDSDIYSGESQENWH